MENKKRLYGLDVLKACAAFLVCYQHACGTGVVSGYLLAFSRIAVPIFILITGYMYKDVHEKKGEKKQIRKFFRIAVEMELLWFAIDSIYNFLKHNLRSYFLNFVLLDNINRFIWFNDPIAADHGWYMWALLYVLVICYTLPFVWKNKICRRCLIAIGGGTY